MDAADRSSLPRRTSTSARTALPRSTDGLPPLDRAFWEILDEGLSRIALELATGIRDAIEIHTRLLLAWNAQINLTALRTPELIARGHVLDSLIAVGALRALGPARPSLLDLGSGAGYPGLLLALVLPARRAALVDSIGKKASFLDAVAQAVTAALRDTEGEPPELVILAERAENLARGANQRETWDMVTARAVGSVAEVAELGLPLVRRGGHVVVWKRDAGDGELQREIANARAIVQAAGGVAPRIVALDGAELVGLFGHCLVVIGKRDTTPDRFPRPAGERRRRALP